MSILDSFEANSFILAGQLAFDLFYVVVAGDDDVEFIPQFFSLVEEVEVAGMQAVKGAEKYDFGFNRQRREIFNNIFLPVSGGELVGVNSLAQLKRADSGAFEFGEVAFCFKLGADIGGKSTQIGAGRTVYFNLESLVFGGELD